MTQVINSRDLLPFVCDDTYSSKYIMGEDAAGMAAININEGTLKAGCNTSGGRHDQAEIYYVLSCGEGAFLWLDDERLPTRPGDTVFIRPNVFHWIENAGCDRPFVLLTFWPRQEQNDTYHARKKAWGASLRFLNP